jgi:TusA-related sulfurtransferase
MTDSKHSKKFDYYLDITSDVCPLTFVRTKLLLERMQPGQTAEVRLQGQMPLENVPKSVQGLGETVVSLTPEDPNGSPFAVHRMILQKN